MKLIALKSGRYGTRALKSGDYFTAQPEYGKIWKLLGMAADAPKEPAAKQEAVEEQKKRGRKPKAVGAVEAVVADAVSDAVNDGLVTPNAAREVLGLKAIESTSSNYVGAVASDNNEEEANG